MKSPRDVPRHVGIIMDGNGRWAEARDRARSFGHRAGAQAVRRVTEAAARLGVQQLSLYAFSTENWRRPQREVALLMRLMRRFLRGEEERLRVNGIRLLAVGRLEELPREVFRELQRVVHATRGGTRMTLCLALNYGGRSEIVDVCRRLARRAVDGHILPDQIDEEAVAGSLYQPNMPPLDLVIRTSGDMRLSNFLLWQIAYAELWITPVPWPDFGPGHLQDAVDAFCRRERRFGQIPARPVSPMARAG